MGRWGVGRKVGVLAERFQRAGVGEGEKGGKASVGQIGVRGAVGGRVRREEATDHEGSCWP